MSIADKALWIIERNSQRSLSVNAIATACEVSRSHIAYAFGTATGMSVMKYLRGRRLSNAARVLADGAPDILAVALDAGYSSHEAFTRAFRDQFGTTPENVRQRRSVEGISLVEPLELTARINNRLDAPRIVEKQTVRVVGLSDQCSFDAVVKIPAQWQRFMRYYAAIPAKAEDIPLGVSRAPNDAGEFQYVCAVEVARFGNTPRELVELEIAPCAYAVFEHEGHISTLNETYSTLWNEALPASGYLLADAPILERHNPTFDPRTGEGGVTLWIPLRT